MIITDPRAFARKNSNIFSSHRRRAREYGQTLDYTCESLRVLVETSASCDYCGVALTTSNFTIDHMTPTSRCGPHAIRNLVVCCVRCNQTKGRLTHGEFHQLVELLKTCPPAIHLDVLARLRAGARVTVGKSNTHNSWPR
jgi:5-methylcytosine-specific restriction endonuclease McrA